MTGVEGKSRGVGRSHQQSRVSIPTRVDTQQRMDSRSRNSQFESILATTPVRLSFGKGSRSCTVPHVSPETTWFSCVPEANHLVIPEMALDDARLIDPYLATMAADKPKMMAETCCSVPPASTRLPLMLSTLRQVAPSPSVSTSTWKPGRRPLNIDKVCGRDSGYIVSEPPRRVVRATR